MKTKQKPGRKKRETPGFRERCRAPRGAPFAECSAHPPCAGIENSRSCRRGPGRWLWSRDLGTAQRAVWGWLPGWDGGRGEEWRAAPWSRLPLSPARASRTLGGAAGSQGTCEVCAPPLRRGSFDLGGSLLKPALPDRPRAPEAREEALQNCHAGLGKQTPSLQ